MTGPDWRAEAACLGEDTGLFFAPDGERETARIRREDRARALCAGCPVTSDCAAFGATERYGIYAGETGDERRARRRRELRRAAAARSCDLERTVA